MNDVDRKDDGCDYRFEVYDSEILHISPFPFSSFRLQGPIRRTWQEAANDCVGFGCGTWDRHVLTITHGEIVKIVRV